MKSKKLLVIVLISLVMLLPFRALAKTYYAGHETKNLKEALEEENITLENKDYKESDKQATIYLFRGSGCGYCGRFLTFLSTLSKEYGDKFKLVSFEVWNNEDNNKLMKEVSTFTGVEASGVPYIVIGEKVFGGYIDTWDDDIKAAINTLYDSKDRYDVFEEIEAAERKARREKLLTSGLLPILNIVATIAFGVVIILRQNKNKKDLLSKINKVNKPVEVVKHEEVKETDNKKPFKKGRR